MRRQVLAVLIAAAVPLAVLAQGGPQQGGPGQGAGNGAGPGRRGDPERMEKRMRLARTLGLAEALDLDAAAALRLGEAIGKFDERRTAAHKQGRDAREVLRRAAQGEKVAAADVDQAIQKALDARAQLAAIDRETVTTVTKDLAPEKKARAVLFLSKFQKRFPGGPGLHGRGGMGPHDGRGQGRGRGPGGGMGPGMGMGPGAGAAGPMMGMGPGGDDLDDDLED